MDAFDFLNRFFTWWGDLVPEWNLLPPTHGGLKFKPGGRIELLKPGCIYWWWPASTDIVTINVKRQTLTFGQRLTTKDDVSIQIDTVIAFTIYDVVLALVETKDFEDTVGEIAQKLTVRPIMSRSFAEIRKDMGESNDMRNEITKGAKKLLTEYGLDVLDAYVCNMTKTRVFSHDGDPGFAGADEEEDDE